MPIFEPSRALWWIDHKIATVAVAAGAAGVFPKAAPDSIPASSIVVIYSMSSGPDRQNASAFRLWNYGLYLVKVTGPATVYDTIVAVMDAVDNALQLQGEEVAGPNNDAYVMRCDREMAVPLPAIAINGVLQEAVGALYRIHIRSLVG